MVSTWFWPVGGLKLGRWSPLLPVQSTSPPAKSTSPPPDLPSLPSDPPRHRLGHPAAGFRLPHRRFGLRWRRLPLPLSIQPLPVPFTPAAGHQALAKELVRSRRAVNRLYENKAQLNSVSMHLGEIVGTARTVGHLSKSAEVMKIVNNLMKAPELATTMQEFSKELTKAGVMEEMVNDAVDSALDSEDMEEEIEEEVDKILASVAGETTSQLPDAVRTQKIKQASTSRVPEERQAVAEGADDDEEDLDLK